MRRAPFDMFFSFAVWLFAEERKTFLRTLLEVSKIKHMRISILSGDAHVAGVGRVYTKPRIRPLRCEPAGRSFRPHATR